MTASLRAVLSCAFVLGACSRSSRMDHMATLLADGKVLIAGGWGETGCSLLGPAELFDPATQTFAATGRMDTPRSDATATRLQDGKVLFAGGKDTSSQTITRAELFDPATGKFKVTGKMSVARSGHTATLLSNGTVLITGGTDDIDPQTNRSAELYQ